MASAAPFASATATSGSARSFSIERGFGSFKKSENGDYAGAVKTLTLNVKARITPVEKTNDKAPDFRIFAGRTDYAELSVMRSGAV